MIEILNITKEMYEKFRGNGSYFLLFGISLLILFLWNQKNKKINLFFILYSLLLMFIFVCPVTAKIIMDFCIGRDVYWRMLWILPYIAVIGYVATNIVFEAKEKWKRFVTLISLLILITSAGTNVYSLIRIDPTTGAAKIPAVVATICDELLKIEDERDLEYVRAIFPDELTPYVRQYDSYIRMPYGREVPKDTDHPIHNILYAETIDYEALTAACTRYVCHFLIISSNEEITVNLKEHGFELITNISGYDIFLFPV